MKLTELNPRWYSMYGVGERVGLTFDCPCCKKVRLGVTFHHRGREAIEDDAIHAFHPGEKIWTMDGDSFNNISLSPSIDASASGHWHGFITNGEVL